MSWSFEGFLEQQKRTATGQRLEMLGKDLSGTRKMLETVLIPVLGTSQQLILEHELVASSGMRIFVDTFLSAHGIVFESEGFVSHAESITRDRFSFERMRIRTFALYGYKYIPFSWDELDKKPEACRRSLYELLGRQGRAEETSLMELDVYEREVLRLGMFRTEFFRIGDVRNWLKLGADVSRLVVHRLVGKGLLSKVGGSERRSHGFEVTDRARQLFWAAAGAVGIPEPQNAPKGR
ncbi:hypothetical protein [Cohnella zeiphila]|uniref:Uncharacterized protein n=1 Tax=Cohnella zeiphila TaxID=2761120 RepID=A0A7X0SLK8_9BACL|nr:hypothetical protein [Cohnella zeiphila]MBB6732181.1 hypothetical protein [Cohnella zeiphila]